MKLKSILSAALVAGVISARAVTAGDTTNSAAKPDAMTALFGDPVVAKGRGFEIKRSELDNVVTSAKANAAAVNRTLPADFEISALNNLVTSQLLLQKATAADKTAGQTESDWQYTNALAHADSPEAFARQLKVVGLTESELRTKVAQEATALAALKRELKLNVADSEIKDYYSNHAASFEMPEKVHVRHILLLTIDPKENTPLSTNLVAAKRKQIDDIQKRAAGGEDFAALAKQYSEDPSSKVAGGELTPFARSQMVPEFEAAAFALKPGQVSDVVSTMYGFHVIKGIDRTPAKKYGLTDYIPQIDKTLAAYCKLQIESAQIQELAPAYVTKLRKDADVQVLDPGLKALEQLILDAGTNAPAAGDSNP